MSSAGRPKGSYNMYTSAGGMTYQAIGAVLGVSHQRVRQIEQGAIAKVRLAARRLRLSAGDFVTEDRPVEGWRRS